MSIKQAEKYYTEDSLKIKAIRPFQLPLAEKKEEYKNYIISLKNDCPCESLDVGDITFAKRYKPKDASYANNLDKNFEDNLIVRPFTAKQVKAIKNHAENKIIKVPRRIVTKTRETGEIYDESVSSFTFAAIDYIIIKTLEEYKKDAVEKQIESIQADMLE